MARIINSGINYYTPEVVAQLTHLGTAMKPALTKQPKRRSKPISTRRAQAETKIELQRLATSNPSLFKV